MKKLNFNIENSGRMLSREEMKKVIGGFVPPAGEDCLPNECNEDIDCIADAEGGTIFTCTNVACGEGQLYKVCIQS